LTVNWGRLLHKGRALILAYDQGLEHGPVEFDKKNVDPEYILNIALEGGYTGIVLQPGVAEKYWHGAYRDVPLIVKLNGKTNLAKIDPISRQTCSVERAVKLGASAVGYTIYDGSPNEPEIFREFGNIVEEAHNYGIPVIAWMYPRGRFIPNDVDNEVLAYSARIGLELGADMVKMKYNGDKENLRWCVRAAGRTKVVIAGGAKEDQRHFLNEVGEEVDAGAVGIAVGRNVWKSENPFSLSKALREVVIDRKSALQAAKHLQ
jgi:class I fructose-bisphosphate aldolase